MQKRIEPTLHSIRDEQVMNSLFRQYASPLYYFAAKFVDDEAARDIVQETFLKLWENDTLVISRSLNGLLFTMVRNLCFQHLEKQKVRNRYRNKALMKLKEEELFYFSGGAMSLIEQELQKKLEETLARLPEKCREVFLLSRLSHKKNAEIAEELGISVKAVEKHITKALKAMREELSDYLPMLALLHPGWLTGIF